MGAIYVACPCGGAMGIVQSAPMSVGAMLSVQCVFQCDRCRAQSLRDVSPQLLQQQGLWTPEPEKPPVPEPEKVIEGSVIGYRAWRIKDWALCGTYADRPWVPGVNKAVCQPPVNAYLAQPVYFSPEVRPSRHDAPALGCHCGITALARFAEDDAHWPDDAIPGAIEAWSDETVDIPQPGHVAAAAGVELQAKRPEHEPHGRFILHGTGFRAQYGKVVLLAVDDDWPVAKKAAVRALAQEHGADVCKRSHLKDAALEHGQLVPDEMLEWAKEDDPEEAMWSIAQYSPFVLSTNQTSTFPVPSQLLTTTVPYRPKPTRKGISQTLGYPGPPQGRLTTYRKGDRVRDKKGQVWQCVKGGKPGRWEQEATAE